MAPLLAGAKASDLNAPLSLLNGLSAGNEAQLHQLVKDVAQHLGLPLQSAASYVQHIAPVKALADGMASLPGRPGVVTAPGKQKLIITVSAEGTAPTQALKVSANRPVEVSRVEYMLSSGATVASDNVTAQGETIQIPINQGSVLKLWNTPRADRNPYDHSGPARIAITVSADGDTNEYILPVQLESVFQNSTAYRRIVGSKTFYAK